MTWEAFFKVLNVMYAVLAGLVYVVLLALFLGDTYLLGKEATVYLLRVFIPWTISLTAASMFRLAKSYKNTPRTQIFVEVLSYCLTIAGFVILSLFAYADRDFSETDRYFLILLSIVGLLGVGSILWKQIQKKKKS